MIYVLRSLVVLLIIESVVCGYLVTNKYFRVVPAVPQFHMDDPLVSRILEKLAKKTHTGTDRDWQHLAEALIGHGFYNYAEFNYQQALKRNPDNVESLFGLAFCLDKTGRMEQSTEQYRQFLKTEQRKPENQKLRFYAMYAIGKNYLRMEKTTEAEQEFRKNIVFVPAAYQLAKLLIRADRAEEAIPIIEKNLEEIPFSLEFHYLNYLAMQKLSRPDDSKAAAEMIEKSAYLVSLNFNNDYIDPFYLKYGQE